MPAHPNDTENAVAPARAWRELRSPELGELDHDACLVVWPVAALEQHGPHLSVGTDGIVLEAIVERVRERLGAEFAAVFLPLMPFGKSPEHLRFPGTVSLRASTLLAISEDLVASLAGQGFTRLVVLNGHGGNTALLQSVAFDLRSRYGVRAFSIDLWASDFFDEAISEIFPVLDEPEVHAASVETSLMLYLCPERVGEIPPASAACDLGPVPCGWAAEDLCDTGVIGDPTLATAEAGERLLDYAVARVCRLLGEIREFGWRSRNT